ncbi:xylanase [Bacteroidales bacterium]|nr:xylanase [Bacteroidales bacterium]
MKRNIILLLGLGLLFLNNLALCSQKIRIDASQKYQTIEGFAASDCWTAEFVGKYWHEAPKKSIAKYLFSQKFQADGSPEGIGLSMWRFNLGGGSSEQGDASDIEDIARRGGCFLDSSGLHYDWSKQAGQQWFLQEAKAYGCESLVAFSNSPLVHYSRNGKAYATGDGKANIKEQHYGDFAEYLATVMQHFKQKTLAFKFLSPVNEPQYDWNISEQEGSPWTNEEIKQLITELDLSIQKRELDTKILIAEAGSWNSLIKKEGRASNQIFDFFDKRGVNYIADLPSLAPIIGAHSYWTHGSNLQLRDTRLDVWTAAKKQNLKVYQTEWSMLGDAPQQMAFATSYDDASYMDIALFMGKIIHSDLAFAQASSWSYWTSMGMELWGHKNRFLLLALEPGGNPYNPIALSGIVRDRSTLWALGNYSFFLRPGFQRIKLIGADDLNGLMGTAYLSPDSSKLVAVYVNMANESKKITTQLDNFNGYEALNNKIYLTNKSYNLKKINGTGSEIYSPDKEINIPARTMASIVYDLKQNTTGISDVYVDKIKVYPNPIQASQILTIDIPALNNHDIVHLLISDLTGKLIYKADFSSANNTLSISLPADFDKGSYVLQIKNENKIYIHKLLVH